LRAAPRYVAATSYDVPMLNGVHEPDTTRLRAANGADLPRPLDGLLPQTAHQKFARSRAVERRDTLDTGNQNRSLPPNAGVWSLARAAAHHEAWRERIQWCGQVPWYEAARGFWRPVDFLAPLPDIRETAPKRAASGFHFIVADGSSANTSLPLAMIGDLGSYDLSRISSSRRAGVRKSLRSSDFTFPEAPDVLLAQGFSVVSAAVKRTCQRAEHDLSTYRASVTERWSQGEGLVLTATRNALLGGYVTGHVIGRRAYLEDVYLNDAGRAWQAGTGLYWHILMAARALGAEEMFVGHWIPDQPALAAFKQSMGARIENRPARLSLSRATEWYLRTWKPVTYVRLGGPPQRLKRPLDTSRDTVVARKMNTTRR
jgi:hypothetical protein